MYIFRLIKVVSPVVLSLFIGLMVFEGLIPPSEAIAQEHERLDKVIQNIVAAQHRPAEVARLIQAAISARPEQAAAVAEAASKAVPALTVLLTAAAVHTAPYRAVEIWQAVSRVASDQASDVQTSADLAVSLATHPNRSQVIIQSELITQPKSTAAIVTTSVTACDILGGCSRTPVQSIVSSAIAVDYEAAESIVETAVKLMPSKSGAIIAAADSVLQSRQTSSSSTPEADAKPTLGAETRGAAPAPPVRVPGSTFR